MKHGNHKIIATFKYGRVWSKKVYLFVSIMFYTAALFFIPLFIWTAATADIPVEGRIVLYIVGPIIAICFALVPFFLGRNRSHVKKCLKDAVERTVFAKLFKKDIALGKSYKGAKLFISFRYESRKVRKYSTWDTCFERFADEEITVLYSPKYDEILICD